MCIAVLGWQGCFQCGAGTEESFVPPSRAGLGWAGEEGNGKSKSWMAPEFFQREARSHLADPERACFLLAAAALSSFELKPGISICAYEGYIYTHMHAHTQVTNHFFGYF